METQPSAAPAARFRDRTRPVHLDLSVSMPCSRAFLPASSAATCAAYGVDLRLPLKPCMPADDQAIVLPCAVRDGDHRVVERGIHMRHAGDDVLALLAAGACGGFRHEVILSSYKSDRNAAKP